MVVLFYLFVLVVGVAFLVGSASWWWVFLSAFFVSTTPSNNRLATAHKRSARQRTVLIHATRFAFSRHWHWCHCCIESM